MSQSALTVALLAAAFVLFLAARGRLTTYTSVLWGAKGGGQAGGSGGSFNGLGGDTSSSGSWEEQAIKLAAEAVMAGG